MKKLVLLLVFAAAVTSVFAQRHTPDMIHLNDGSVIRGHIVELTPNESLKLETEDGSLLIYRMDEIEKITRGSSPRRDVKGDGFTSGYKGMFEIGYGLGMGDFGLDRFKLEFINGHQFNPSFSMGFGLGLRRYPVPNATLFSMFADFRTFFINNDQTPYLSLGLGYSFDASNSFESMGLLIDPHFGLSFKVSESVAMNFGVGLELQRVTVVRVSRGYGYNPSYVWSESREFTNAFNFVLGLSF